MSTVAVLIASSGVVICADTLHLELDSDGTVVRGEVDKAAATDRFALGHAGVASITIPGDGTVDNHLDIHALLVSYATSASNVAAIAEQLRADSLTVLAPFLNHAGEALAPAAPTKQPATAVISVAVVDRRTHEYCTAEVRSDGTVAYAIDQPHPDRSGVTTIVLGHNPGHAPAPSSNLDALRLHGLSIVADAARTAPTIGGLPTVGGRARWCQLEGPNVAGGTVELPRREHPGA